ncbi:MAG: Bcr/CflA family efflux MFS transporter [Alteromonadaceae bacterium]|nr:Bcr/CflA family efflux MFS transporter [Alteromonadaceae bacterium]
MTQPHNDKSAHAQATLSLPEFVTLMALLTSLVALSIDTMLPALSMIGDDLNSPSMQHTHMIITLFFFGMAFGQLVFGPICDSFGRRFGVYLGSLIFCLGTLICMAATTMEVMLLGRLIQAFGVSGPRIATMAMIRDIYVGDRMARVMSFIMVVFIMVPMMAPIIGQAILRYFTWHYIFAFFFVMVILSVLWLALRQPETLVKADRRKFTWSEFFIASRFILTHREVWPYMLGIGLVFGGFLGYLGATQTIFVGFYDVGDWFAYIFAALAFSIGCASLVNAHLVERLGMVRLCQLALRGHLLLSVMFVIAQILYQGLAPLAVTIGLLFVNFFFVGILFGNINSLAMEPLGEVAGLGAALLGAISSVVAVLIALVVDAFLVDTLIPIGIGFVSCCILTMTLFKYARN